MRCCVSSSDETPRRDLKRRLAAALFLMNFEVFHLVMKHCVECSILLFKQNYFKRRNLGYKKWAIFHLISKHALNIHFLCFLIVYKLLKSLRSSFEWRLRILYWIPWLFFQALLESFRIWIVCSFFKLRNLGIVISILFRIKQFLVLRQDQGVRVSWYCSRMVTFQESRCFLFAS